MKMKTFEFEDYSKENLTENQKGYIAATKSNTNDMFPEYTIRYFWNGEVLMYEKNRALSEAECFITSRWINGFITGCKFNS